MTETRRLPETIDEMKAVLKKMFTEESKARGLAFRPRPNDVLIATYPKCGTTWIQQIVHGLRSNGSMQFEEICEVIPWIETAFDLGQECDAPQVASPRAFKTHLSWDHIMKGARYIYVIRDPKQVLLSFYHFFSGFMFVPGSISLEAFANSFFITGSKSGRYWEHLCSWWPQRHEDHTLFLTFDELKRDLDSTVRRIAGFVGCTLTEDQMLRVIHQSSYAFMHDHRHQFDDHFLIDGRREASGLPAGTVGSKVRNKDAQGTIKHLPDDLSLQLDALWAEEIETVLGFASYDELVDQLDRENQALKQANG